MGKTRILVVENEAIVAEDIKLKLESFGYEVTATAFSGEEAVELAAGVQPDLVLMDIRMPGKMDGIDAAIRIKETCDVPVVFVSAFADKETLDRAKIAQPVGFIIKPFIELELQKTVEIALYGHSMEMKVRQSEAKYRTLVETTDTGFLILDGQGRVQDANREYVRLTGHSELREILGRSVTEWTAAHEQQKNAEAVAKCVRDGRIRNFVIEYVDGKGWLTPVEINATVTVEGEALRIVSLCRDITERKRAESELRRSEILFSTIFRMSSAATILSELEDGRCVDANEAYAEMTGYSRDEILGRTAAELNIWMSPEERRRDVLALSKAGWLNNIEITLRKKDGSLRSTIASAEIVTIEGKQLILAFFYDITARKQAEEELRASKEKYRALVENLNDLIFSVNAEGILTFINPVVEQITGHKPEELIGQPFTRFIYPPDLPALMEQFRVVLGGKIGPDEYRLVTKTGEIRWVRSSSRPVIENGKAVGIQGVATDITEHKQAGKHKRKSL